MDLTYLWFVATHEYNEGPNVAISGLLLYCNITQSERNS